MNRFTIKGTETSHYWEVFDTITGITVTFKEGYFNESQKFGWANAKTTDAQTLANAARELTDWLIKEHRDLLIEVPDDMIKDDARRAIGAALKTARKEQGLTIRQVEEMTGIANNHISRIENGKYNVTIDTVALIAAALGLESIPLRF